MIAMMESPWESEGSAKSQSRTQMLRFDVTGKKSIHPYFFAVTSSVFDGTQQKSMCPFCG